MTEEKKEATLLIANAFAIAPCQVKGGTDKPDEIVNGTMLEFELAGGERIQVVTGANLADLRAVFEKAFTEGRCLQLDLTPKSETAQP